MMLYERRMITYGIYFSNVDSDWANPVYDCRVAGTVDAAAHGNYRRSGS